MRELNFSSIPIRRPQEVGARPEGLTTTDLASLTDRVAALEAAPSAGVLKGDAVVTIPGPSGALYWEETVPALDVTPASRVFVTLAPALDADENCPELLDLGSVAGLAGTDEITIMATFAQAATGPIKLHWSAA